MSTATPAIVARARRALQFMFVSDALSMPVHWFYDPSKIVEQYGENGITKFEKAPEKHLYNFMSLPERLPGADKDVVGDIILKGKKDIWIAGAKDKNINTHVHQGMQAGDNTLNLCVARWLMSTLASSTDADAGAKLYNQKQWLDKFTTLMQTEGSHPDSYAEGCWRNYFNEYLKQQISNGYADLTKCGVKADGNYSAGSLMGVAPLIISELIADRDVKRVQGLARAHMNLTAPHDKLPEMVDIYTVLIDALLFRDNDADVENILKNAAAKFAEKSENFNKFVGKIPETIPSVYTRDLFEADSKVIGEFGLACDLSQSWPNVLYLTLKYVNAPHLALLGNTNLGGENCHRGAVLGSILGLTYRESSVSETSSKIVDGFVDGLKHKNEINSEIDALLTKAGVAASK